MQVMTATATAVSGWGPWTPEVVLPMPANGGPKNAWAEKDVLAVESPGTYEEEYAQAVEQKTESVSLEEEYKTQLKNAMHKLALDMKKKEQIAIYKVLEQQYNTYQSYIDAQATLKPAAKSQDIPLSSSPKSVNTLQSIGSTHKKATEKEILDLLQGGSITLKESEKLFRRLQSLHSDGKSAE